MDVYLENINFLLIYPIVWYIYLQGYIHSTNRLLGGISFGVHASLRAA